METKAPVSLPLGEFSPPRALAPSVVIVDSGHEARLVLLDSSEAATIGHRFRHAGSTWQITGRRPHSKAYVAEPASH